MTTTLVHGALIVIALCLASPARALKKGEKLAIFQASTSGVSISANADHAKAYARWVKYYPTTGRPSLPKDGGLQILGKLESTLPDYIVPP